MLVKIGKRLAYYLTCIKRSIVYSVANNDCPSVRCEYFAEDQATRREGPELGAFLPFNT